MMLSTPSTGKMPANMAGMMAKYLATSLAILKVVSAPRFDVEHRSAVALSQVQPAVAYLHRHCRGGGRCRRARASPPRVERADTDLPRRVRPRRDAPRSEPRSGGSLVR